MDALDVLATVLFGRRMTRDAPASASHRNVIIIDSQPPIRALPSAFSWYLHVAKGRCKACLAMGEANCMKETKAKHTSMLTG
jgi:hypothetical protein